MQTISRSTFTTVTTEGAILPADLLQRIVDGRDLDGLKPTDYHLAPNERLNEAINRSWNRLLGVWESFDERRQELPDHDRGTTLTREGWLLILLDELGYGRPTFVSSLSVNGESGEPGEDGEGARYPISHLWQQTPLHLISFRQSLDRVDDGNQRLLGGERFRRSPHSLLQEFLNRSQHHLWGIVSNGLRLRILRDNVSFTRAAYLEFDLEAMMDGEIYADFTLLWLVAHQSRFEGDPQTCWLEKWSQAAAEQGTRALDSLRDGVQNAISELGRGFLAHPANKDLRAALQAGDGLEKGLDKQDYYRQLLRLVYRLIFLFVAEERNLLLLPEAGAVTRQRYYDHYSVTHLRELAARRRSGPHPDLYRTLRLVLELLREGYEPLGLPGLGSFLFSERSTPDLDHLEIANEALLKAIRALTFTVQDGVLRPVDYKNLGSEELGSVYESLLELHPELNVPAATFNLRTAAGSERKTTGSYYTPTSLINSLLDTALEPVIADRLQGARTQIAQMDADRNLKKSASNQRNQRPILEQALLSIKIVDPAAGSGHFLIAAANRLARHLARIRTGDEEPSPEAAREALRDVVRHCIHGVDVNEMAVELCKVSLWLETLDPGKPLNFLDANIQHGNSLIGATPELLDDGIPDEAFTPVTGDDKGFAREFKALNREQHKGQMALFKGGQPWQRLGDLAAALSEMAALEGDTLDGVRAQEEAYAALVRSQEYQYGKLWADAWCAAFFWPLLPEDRGGFPYPITEEEFRRIQHNPFSIPAWMREEIQRLAHEHHFFHWHLAFPNVFKLNAGDRTQINAETTQIKSDQKNQPSDLRSPSAKNLRNQRSISGGFDVVLGNPPWERIKLQEKEWFATRSPEIANARNAAARRKLIKALPQTDPDLHAAFMRAKKATENESHFARKSGRYPLSAVGDINTYQLFAGLSRQICNETGRVGIIVPSGIASDYYNQNYFNAIVQNRELVSLNDFENRQKLFPEVDSRMKFCLLTLTGPARPAPAAEYLFFAHSAADLQDKERRFTLSPEEIARINPNTKTAPIFRSRRDAELTKGIYRVIPAFVTDGGNKEVNPWAIYYLRLVDYSDYATELHDLSRCSEEGYYQIHNHWFKDDRVLLPVYESKLINSYDHRFATYEGSSEVRETSRVEKNNPAYSVQPRYWVTDTFFSNTLMGKYPTNDRGWFLSYRDVARSTDARTVISTVFPRLPASRKQPVLGFETALEGHLLLANLGSIVLDFVARQKIGGISMSYFIVKQLPVLEPHTYGEACKWHPNNTLSKWILLRILELTYTAYDLRPFAQDLGYHGPPFRWDEGQPGTVGRRFLLRCELDAAYFHLYGIARDDVDYIMDTFPIVRRKDEEAYGEYRTKRVILEIYDEMAQAWNADDADRAQIKSDQKNQRPISVHQRPISASHYQTRLNPPPAHPDAAHPWHEEYLGPELPREAWWEDRTQIDADRTQIKSEKISAPSAQSASHPRAAKEPGPSFELKPPSQKQPQPKTTANPAAQPPLITEFTPLQGNRSQRLKQVMALGDRAKANRQDAAAIAHLVAALGDEDESIRWLAGSALGLLGGETVVRTLGAYLEQVDDEAARKEALKALRRIAENEREDEDVREMARSQVKSSS